MEGAPPFGFSSASVFDAVQSGAHVDGIEVVARPGHRLQRAPKPGDTVLVRALAEGGLCARWTVASSVDEQGALVQVGGRDRPVRVLDPSGRALPDVAVVRHRPVEAQPVEAVPSAPSWMPLFPHTRERVAGGFWGIPWFVYVTSPDPTSMNPGFIDWTAGRPLTTASLQQDLTTALAASSVYNSFIRQSGNRVHIALVDLTGARQNAPELAERQSTRTIYSASSAKVGAVVAAYQLRQDMRVLAAATPPATRQTLDTAWSALGVPRYDRPLLRRIFTMPASATTPLPRAIDFTTNFRHKLRGTIAKAYYSNPDAGELIERLGYRFIASSSWTLGLYGPGIGGIWVGRRYGSKGKKWRGGSVGKSWRAGPLGGSMHACTALSLATAFTLLGQRALVSSAATTDMRALFATSDSYLKPGLAKAGRFGSGAAIFGKTGRWSKWTHDSALIERTTSAGKALRYVAVVLTRDNRPQTKGKALIRHLAVLFDQIIEARNP